jgi:cell wall assembly regulator SMI1
MKDYLCAVDLINGSGDGDFEGEKSDSLIEKAEKILNLKFPPTYRRFLKEFGCGDIAGEEFYGLINDEFVNSTVPNGIWLILNERKNISLSKDYVLISATGNGNYYALDTAHINDAGECQVISLSLNGEKLEVVAEDFGNFLYNTINAVL